MRGKLYAMAIWHTAVCPTISHAQIARRGFLSHDCVTSKGDDRGIYLYNFGIFRTMPRGCSPSSEESMFFFFFWGGGVLSRSWRVDRRATVCGQERQQRLQLLSQREAHTSTCRAKSEQLERELQETDAVAPLGQVSWPAAGKVVVPKTGGAQGIPRLRGQCV